MKKTLLFLFYSIFTIALSAQSFTSAVNQSLAEGTVVNITQSVSGIPINQNYYYGLFEIDINLTHSATSEVYINLIAPDGTVIQLTSGFGNGSNFNHTTFRSFASEYIGNANIINNGKYMPVNKFTDLQNNSDPNGTWTLQYFDANSNSVVGTLLDWTLKFTYYPNQLATDSMVSNLPIINFIMPSAIPSNPKLAGSMQLFNTGANSIINTPTNIYNVGVELQGYTSSGGNKPNYDFEIRTAIGASLNVPLLGMPAESDWILKSGYTDNFLMKDPLTFEFSRRMGYYAPRTKHVELFINGEYQGVYILMEKIKRAADRVDISKLKPSDTTGINLTGGYIFEINPNGAGADWYSNYLGYQGTNLAGNYEFKIVYPKKDSIQQKQKDYLHAYVDSFEDAMNSATFQDAITGWRKYVDEKSFIDFLIVSEYSLNYDTYGRSMYFSKQKSTKGNKIQVGPPWDSDRGYEANGLDDGWVHITTHGYWIFPFWWVKVRQDTLFEKRLACRFKTVRNYIITDTAIENYIDGMDAILLNAREREVVKWNKYFEPSVNLKNTLISRLNWMDTSLLPSVFPPIPNISSVNYINNPININIGSQYKYNFRPGPDTSYFNPGVTGFYTAVIANQYGCESQKKFSVDIPAPLTIASIDFFGNWFENNSELKWNVKSINNIKKFELEHSKSGIDFVVIKEFECSGENYTYLDKTKYNENFYRLKIINKNGSTHYSKIVSICKNKISGSNFYPNPAKNILYLQHNTADKINIYNANGKLIISQSHNNVEIDIRNLVPGIYKLQIISGNEVASEQFVKE
jgi:subtilisin-like proprotein convertase family protein